MTNFESLEPAIDPENRITFLLDWELTLKCNLDCSYCETGMHGGHDNSIPHPPLEQCLKTIDFMYKYVDLYMRHKIKGIKYVILNVYGGESLHHPDIVEILAACRQRYQEQYQNEWHLTITTTTNAIVSEKKIDKIIPFIDEFTCSYHTENSNKQKQQFKRNLNKIKSAGKRLKVIALMHAESELFTDAQELTDWCNSNQIRVLPRQIDHGLTKTQFNYNAQQVKWFDSLYQTKSFNTRPSVEIKVVEEKFDLTDSGRACCGGRQVCKDNNQRERHFFVENKFPDWFCSVNEFFLFIKQVNGEIYVNKDCKMNFTGEVAPIGTLDAAEALLDWTRNNLKNHTMPVIQCKKYRCVCGLCAPKAKNLETFNSIMRKYRT
jgi:pyruvate-formate lyase-activating enzyme